jgi:DNA-binding CsgD family transcriptional regulator/tetratricopeptide (TPR) repeat protein
MESMLCPVLIGRAAELETLTSALEEAAHGHGGAVFITGDAGIGKSRLARDLSALASSQGFRVLTGRATQSTVLVPYRPVTEALMGAAREGIVPDSAGIGDYRAALASLVPEWSRSDDKSAEISPVILGEALLRILTMPCSRGGLLVLEDLHWADPETLAVVEYLADNVAESGVLCVLTLRDSEPSGCADLLHSAVGRRVASRIDLPRLTPGAVGQMAAACLALREVPTDVGRLLADCDGLPFAVEEILAAAVSSGELVRRSGGWHVNSDISTGVPESIVGSVRRRLAALGPVVAGVIVSAAILGRQFDWTLLPKVAGVTEPEVLDALQRAREVQLIEPVSAETCIFRFRHSLTRDAIVSNLLPPDHASRSAAAAAAIEQAHPGLPGTWCELAAELHATAGQPEAAARLLLTAGRRALLPGAVGSATAALAGARKVLEHSLVPQPDLDVEIDEVLVEALALAGDYEHLVPVAEGLLARLEMAGGDPRRQALILLRVASTRPEDNLSAAAAKLAAAEAIAERLHETELASQVDAVGARCALAAGELDRAEGRALRALAAAESAGLSGWASEVALVALEVIGRRERMRDQRAARAAFERVYQIADDAERGVWRIRALHELGTIDMLDHGSADRLVEVRELAQQAGIMSTATTIELQLANLWSLGTDLERAMTAARQCERNAAQLGVPRVEAMAICLQANILGTRTEYQEAEQAAQRAERVLPGDPELLFTIWGLARVIAALFRDDVPRAVKASLTGMDYASQVGTSPLRARSFYSPLQAPVLAPRRAWGLYVLLQAISDGDAREAIEAARAAGVALSWNQGYVAYAEAMLAGRDGDRSLATALAGEGSAHLAPFASWWNHLARRLVAPAALRDGWGQPVAWMREAAADFEVTSHDALASACRGVLRRAGERVPRSGRGSAQVPAQMRRLGITSREMDVFLLLARGHSNSEIAARLYISPKTVETHIASLATKTGKTGRRELVAHAARVASSLAPVFGVRSGIP